MLILYLTMIELCWILVDIILNNWWDSLIFVYVCVCCVCLLCVCVCIRTYVRMYVCAHARVYIYICVCYIKNEFKTAKLICQNSFILFSKSFFNKNVAKTQNSHKCFKYNANSEYQHFVPFFSIWTNKKENRALILTRMK